jgi:predicted anti-sigma-YlaC factor YlaD
MNIMHPENQELQRFLSKQGTELELRRVARHLAQCGKCRKRLEDFAELEARLVEELPLLQAPDSLTDRIMQQVYTKPWERESLSGEKPSRQGWWRPELMNGLVAIAATFVLILTGIPRKLMHLDPQQLESGVELTVLQVSAFIQNVSQQLLT